MMESPKAFDFDPGEIEYDSESERYHLSFDPEQVLSPSMVVVQLVSHITEIPVLSLPQFYSAVDADSLDTWFSGTEDQQMDFQIEFSYAGCEITLDGDGNIWVQPTEGERMNIGNGDSA